jgi:hypothetical protein
MNSLHHCCWAACLQLLKDAAHLRVVLEALHRVLNLAAATTAAAAAAAAGEDSIPSVKLR